MNNPLSNHFFLNNGLSKINLYQARSVYYRNYILQSILRIPIDVRYRIRTYYIITEQNFDDNLTKKFLYLKLYIKSILSSPLKYYICIGRLQNLLVQLH